MDFVNESGCSQPTKYVIFPDLGRHRLQGLQSLNYPMKLQKLLLTPQREVLVELCITKDNGEIETFNAYRSAILPSGTNEVKGIESLSRSIDSDCACCSGFQVVLAVLVLRPRE